MITIITGLISGAIAIIVCVINNVEQSRRHEEVTAVHIAEIKEDIKRLEKKQDIHNTYMERIAKLEAKVGD